MGTPHYVAPEMIEDNSGGPFSDLWALGVIAFEMLTNRHPFFGVNKTQLFDNIVEGNFGFPDNIDPVAKDLIEKLLHPNPVERLGYSEF